MQMKKKRAGFRWRVALAIVALLAILSMILGDLLYIFGPAL